MTSHAARHHFRRSVLVLVAALLGLFGLTVPGSPLTGRANAVVAIKAFGSVDAAYLSAPAGATATLFDASQHVAGTGTVDTLGALVLHDVKSGPGYHFVVKVGAKSTSTPSFVVLSTPQAKPASFYNAVKLHVGLNYLPMRDGITLAATVRLPAGKTSLSQGPFPTVIEYSGYGTAAPGSLLAAELHQYTGDPALLPDTATAVGALLAPTLGFAVVSLQMRGTGCSGGAFDLFGPSEPTDGYDAVQEVAAQSWVKGHKTGLVGISYSGMSQFAVAALQPSGLASIAPLSPTDDLYSTGLPGGIANTGFAASWIADRVHDAKPASATQGQRWAWAEIGTGDATCLANQQFHGQAQDVESILATTPTRVASLYDPRSQAVWATKIKVPVFLVGALQDEQTGPQWTSLISALAKDPHVFATMQNGTHGDSLDPDVLNRWIAFNDLFVAKAVPKTPGLLTSLIVAGLSKNLGGSVALPAVPQVGATTYARALAAFEKSQARVTVNFDNGNSSAGAGFPQYAYSAGFTSFPPSTATPRTYFLANAGQLQLAPPSASTVQWSPNPTLRPAITGDLPGFSPWSAQPNYDWTAVTGNSAVGFTTAPLSHNLTVVGDASLNVWLSSTSTDTDLQVTVSEVRPNGQEMYVTSGFLRASFASTINAAASSLYHPVYRFDAAHQHLLVANGAPVLIRVPIDAMGYTFRAGSRLRVTIEAPGGDRPSWAFTSTFGPGTTNTLSLGPSTLVLPSVASVTATDVQPPCATNRGQPCRTYVAAANGG